MTLFRYIIKKLITYIKAILLPNSAFTFSHNITIITHDSSKTKTTELNQNYYIFAELVGKQICLCQIM